MLFSRSRQIHFVGILCAFALAGCGGGHSNSGPGYATFTWSIYDIEDPSYTVPLGCAAVGGGSVVVTLVDSAGTAYTQDPVSCAVGQMSTSNVPAGSYTVGFDLYGDPAIYGNSTTLLDSFDATGTFHVVGGANDFRSQFAPFIVQSFTVRWAFNSGSALSLCGLAGGSSVELAFNVGGPTITSSFPCTAGTGVSYAIPFGPTSAQWNLYLVNSAGTDVQAIPGGSVALPSTTNVNLPTQYFTY